MKKRKLAIFRLSFIQCQTANSKKITDAEVKTTAKHMLSRTVDPVNMFH